MDRASTHGRIARLVRGRTQPEINGNRPVQLGAASVSLIEIKSGLRPGDKVILSDMSQYDGVAAIVLR